jgi:hypothetical protein
MLRQILRWDLVAGALKTGIPFGAAFAQRRDGAMDLFFAFANVGVDFLLMREVRIHDGIQGHTSSGDVESAVSLFDVLATLHVSSMGVSATDVSWLAGKPDSESDSIRANAADVYFKFFSKNAPTLARYASGTLL